MSVGQIQSLIVPEHQFTIRKSFTALTNGAMTCKQTKKSREQFSEKMSYQGILKGEVSLYS
jgi:hypothetical protein